MRAKIFFTSETRRKEEEEEGATDISHAVSRLKKDKNKGPINYNFASKTKKHLEKTLCADTKTIKER